VRLERNAPVVSSFSPSLQHGVDHPNLPIFWWHSRIHRLLHTHESANELDPLFKALSVSGRFFRTWILSSLHILTTTESPAAVLVFSYNEYTYSVSDGAWVIGSRRPLICSLHLPSVYPSLLSKTIFSSLIDLGVLYPLPRRRRMVSKNNLLVCQYLEPSLGSKLFQDCILNFFTVRAAEFRASAYRECKEDSVLF